MHSAALASAAESRLWKRFAPACRGRHNRNMKNTTTTFTGIKWRLLLLVLLFALASVVRAVPPVGGDTNFYINAWSFLDTTNWTSDYGTPAVSFTNVASSPLGNGGCLVVD